MRDAKKVGTIKPEKKKKRTFSAAYQAEVAWGRRQGLCETGEHHAGNKSFCLYSRDFRMSGPPHFRVFPDQIDKGKTEQKLKTSKLLKPTATQRKL